MDFDNCDRPVPEKKLSEQFVEFIDLTDEDLEEIDILEFGGVHGGRGMQWTCCSYCGKNCGCEQSSDSGDYGDDSNY